MESKPEMQKTELKLHPCYCGGEMEIKKVAQDGGMDGLYEDWKLYCKKCGLTKTYAADGFYGRKYKTFEEVIEDWNQSRQKEKIIKADILDKIISEIDLETRISVKHYTNTDAIIDAVLDVINNYKAEVESQEARIRNDKNNM